MKKFIINLFILFFTLSFSLKGPTLNKLYPEDVVNPPIFEKYLLGTVFVTMYHPVKEQTNDHPNIVADGTKFDTNKASDLKWIAISRDLHNRWGGPLGFGDIIYLEIIGKECDYLKTGFYKVKDLMNGRFTMRVDILETPGTNIYKFESAYLYMMESPIKQEILWTKIIDNRIIF